MNARAAAVDTRTVLEVHGLAVEFAGRSSAGIRPVRGVSFSIERGRRLGLVGESGSGKSLTALAVMRLLPAQARIASGTVCLDDRDLTQLSEREMASVRGGKIAMVYQDPMSSLNPLKSIGSQIVEAIRIHEPLNRVAAHRLAVDLLGQVGIPQPERRFESYPHQFSGGMRQRAMIAMAICANPDVLIADEPTTALDVTTQARIMDLLDAIVLERGLAVMLITHDLGLAGSFCDEIQVMYGGRIVEHGAALPLFEQPVHPYTDALLQSICRLDRDVSQPITAIPGNPPAPQNLPGGCPFHPRCAFAKPVCAETEPALLPTSNGRLAACHFAEERAVR